jgi:hypothetical protein
MTHGMNEKTLRALIEAGAVRRMRIIANGGSFHIEADTPTGSVTALTTKRAVKTWGTLDAAARWVRGLGIGTAQIDLTHWQPGQRALRV